MKTYPLLKDGNLVGFEVGNTWITVRGMSKFLSQKNGITNIKSKNLSHSDNRLEFNFKGQSFIVEEPFGDNSRYGIFPVELQSSLSQTKELEVIFKELKPSPLKIIFSIMAGAILLREVINIILHIC